MIRAPLAEAVQDINEWAKETQGLLRSTVPTHSGTLAKSIKSRVRIYRGQPDRITFNFERYGAWLEKGASRGHGGQVGSSWRDKYGIRKTTNPRSFGKMGNQSRPERPWFDPVIDQRFPYLADLVELHYARALIKHIHMK